MNKKAEKPLLVLLFLSPLLLFAGILIFLLLFFYVAGVILWYIHLTG